MSKKILRFLSAMLAMLMLFSGISLQITTAFAEEADDTADVVSTDGQPIVSDDSDLISYDAYTNQHGITNKATSDYQIPLDAFAAADGAEVAINENTLTWDLGEGTVTWSFTVPETALYNLEFVWQAKSSGVDINMGVMIDGEYLFDGADEIILSRLWKNATEKPREDVQGNQYAQEQVEIDGAVTSVVRDYETAIVDPFEFALTAGEHTITLVKPQQSIDIMEINLKAPEEYISYNEYLEEQSVSLSNTSAKTIYLEGENADLKTSNSIIPKSNNSNAGMSPSNSYLTMINYIGGTAWQTSGSSLTWNFEVSESGYYYINMRYKQSDLVNGTSYRWLKIDGETPFEEAKTLSFPYGTDWKYYTFGKNSSNPYYVYLEAGPHTISLEVTVADQSEYFNRLKELVDILGDEYIKIVMITGESPDVNRDYDLDKQIPNFLETLKSLSSELGKLSKDMTNGTGQASQAVASIDNMKRVVDNMIRSPYIAQQYVSEYYTNYTSLSSWLYDMIEMPLALDQIQIVPKGKDYTNNNANFFEQLYYDGVRLVSSFTNDYSLTNSQAKNDENTIRLWVNWGQDQAAALNSIIQDSFTQNEAYYYNGEAINVQVEIVNASLINGILAGNFPDMSLQMARTEPVNMGIRGALADLSEMEGFDEVITRFQNGSNLEYGAVAPYTYNGKTYALPDTQNFMLMFYREDILKDLGLEVPNTWDEFLYCATIIQRKNMNVYVPYTQITTSTTVNAGIGNLHLYPTLMWQHGLSIYNEEGNATAIATKDALKVFEEWTDFYLEYSFLKEADFYNRMRVGVMPLGIAPYTTYMTFYATAPEIRGRWSIALVPGTVVTDENGNPVLDENGNEVINRSVAGSGTGCAIVQKSTKKEQAWKFLQWWTSAETQTRYNNNLQSILGMIGRNAVSNVEAFNNLAWDKEDLEILNEQWSYVKEVQEVPGSYDVTRSIDQAFWAVLEDGSKVKDAVAKWAKSADKEIQRKIEEYQ